MKVVTELNSKKSPVLHLKNPVQTFLSLSLLVLSLFVLLTACDDRTRGPSTSASASASVSPAPNPQAPATAASSSATVLAQPTQTSYQPIPTARPQSNIGQSVSSQEVAPPTLNFWPQMVEIGQKVQLSGQDYPANTQLVIRFSSSDFKADTVFATVRTDEGGAFSTTLKLEPLSVNSLLTPGKIEIAVTTPDGRIGASAPLALQPAANSSQDDASKNLVSEFFAAYRRDSSLAVVYLSTGLRDQLAGGKTSLRGLLGSANPPLRVEVSKVSGSTASYQTVLYFSGGEQKSVVLDVSTDNSGALKISAIRAANS